MFAMVLEKLGNNFNKLSHFNTLLKLPFKVFLNPIGNFDLFWLKSPFFRQDLTSQINSNCLPLLVQCRSVRWIIRFLWRLFTCISVRWIYRLWCHICSLKMPVLMALLTCISVRWIFRFWWRILTCIFVRFVKIILIKRRGNSMKHKLLEIIQVTVRLHTDEFIFVWFYKNENGRQNRFLGDKTELLRRTSATA